MKAKLIVDDKEFDIEITDPRVHEFVSKPGIYTGYERVYHHNTYYLVSETGKVCGNKDGFGYDTLCYDIANYYSDKTVAENNARADKLMRQLRRFAVKHREFKDNSHKEFKDDCWAIAYNDTTGGLSPIKVEGIPIFGLPWFNSERAVNKAIRDFHKELIWYFTEYKDSL